MACSEKPSQFPRSANDRVWSCGRLGDEPPNNCTADRWLLGCDSQVLNPHRPLRLGRGAKAVEKRRFEIPAEWLEARKAMRAKEKKFTRLRDLRSRLRRELPWPKMEGEYIFDGPDGKIALADLLPSGPTMATA